MKKIIMDCDPGHDDAIALLLATRADCLELIGVTTVAGNSDLRHTTANALKVLEYADVYDIPVYAGCSKPLMRDLFRHTGAIIHGEDGLGGPHIPFAARQCEGEHAVQYLARTLRETKEKLTVVATGPLTNIAAALTLDESVKNGIDEIIVMGGAIREAGNITSAAEFNIYVDPEAAKIVFSSGCRLRVNPLDITMKALFLQEDIDKLALGGKVSEIVAELLQFFGQAHLKHFGDFVCPIHDATCVAALIAPELIEYEPVFLDVSVNDELTRGETVADIWRITGRKENARIGTKINREKFVSMIIEHLSRPYVSKRS